MQEEIMLIMYRGDNKDKVIITRDKCVNLGIDREISIEEMIMATMINNKIIVGEISMIIIEEMIMDDKVVIIDTRGSLIKLKVRITRTIRGISTINSTSNKVTKLNPMGISNTKDKIIKCSHISTGKEETISNNSKDRVKTNINIKTITIKEITISNNRDTTTIIKETIILTITIIITTDYEKRKCEFLIDRIIFNVYCYFFVFNSWEFFSIKSIKR